MYTHTHCLARVGLHSDRKSDDAMMKTRMDEMNADIGDVAPRPMLNDVRARAAVAGMPPKRPDAMLARPRPKTSRGYIHAMVCVCVCVYVCV